MLRNEVVSLSHNDLDALGCMLNIEMGLPNIHKEYYHTNYKDITEVVYEVEDYLKQHNPGLLMITDISFAEHKSLLQSLVQCADDLKIKVIYIDHHVYPEGFFDDFSFTYSHDKTKSATQLTHEFFSNQLKNDDLDDITNLINMYDIWLIEQSRFKLSLNLNDYFWEFIRESSIQKLMEVIVQNDYKMPRNYNERILHFQTESKVQIEKFRERKLIHCDGYTTIAFVDEYFSEILYAEFMKGIKVVLIANSYGIIRCRFNSLDGILDTKTKEKMKFDIIGTLDKGHINAFSLKVKDNSFKTIMAEIKRISVIIQNHK